MIGNEYSDFASETQHETTPAQDIISACVALKGLASFVDDTKRETLQLVIANLMGVADEIDGLVRPEESEKELPKVKAYLCMAEENGNGRDNWEEALFIAASSAAEAAEEAVTYHFPDIALTTPHEGFCRKNIRVLETETGEVSTWCVSHVWTPQAYHAALITPEESETARG